MERVSMSVILTRFFFGMLYEIFEAEYLETFCFN